MLAKRLPTYFEGVATKAALLPHLMPTPNREQRRSLETMAPAAAAELQRICSMDAALYAEARTVLEEAKSVCL